VRFRTAAILSAVLVGGTFILPAVVEATLLPSLQNPVPGYEQVILAVARTREKSRFHSLTGAAAQSQGEIPHTPSVPAISSRWSWA
jgi:hypothetical protein